MAKKFCTVEDVKLYANSAPSFHDPDDSPQLTRFIEAATSKIISYTRRNWELDFHVDYFDLPFVNWRAQPEHRFPKYWLKSKPLRMSPTPLKVEYTLGPYYGDARLNYNDFRLLDRKYYRVHEEESSITLLLPHIPQIPEALKVSYVAGFEADPSDPNLLLVDPVLKEACAMQAAFMYTRTVNETLGLKKHEDKAGTKEYNMLASGFIQEVQHMLMPYVKPLTGG